MKRDLTSRRIACQAHEKRLQLWLILCNTRELIYLYRRAASDPNLVLTSDPRAEGFQFYMRFYFVYELFMGKKKRY